MTDVNPSAVEANLHGAPIREPAPPFAATDGERSPHDEINARRAQTENADALRRLRAL